jgi:hypothetical protein
MATDGLAEALTALREELAVAEGRERGYQFRFETTEAEVEFMIDVVGEDGAEARPAFRVVSLKADGTASQADTHRLRLNLRGCLQRSKWPDSAHNAAQQGKNTRADESRPDRSASKYRSRWRLARFTDLKILVTTPARCGATTKLSGRILKLGRVSGLLGGLERGVRQDFGASGCAL